jgi:hypothetical protein
MIVGVDVSSRRIDLAWLARLTTTETHGAG